MDRAFLAHIEALVGRLRDYPPEAWHDLYKALYSIERKHNLLEEPTPEDLAAIRQGEAEFARGEYITQEELEVELSRTTGFSRIDPDALGKEDFEDALNRVRKLTGEEQGDIAGVIFGLLGQYRYDIPPPEGE
jgi:hypothetical protein